MPTYNFKREVKLYAVYNGLRYLIDVYPDISFSQTFAETPVPVKTLHTQSNMFEKAVINRANPANFNFTIPLLDQLDMAVIVDLLLDYDTAQEETLLKTADFYVVANTDVYKLEKAVLESGVFQITKDRPLSLAVSGTASKLTKFVGTLPGTLQTRGLTRNYIRANALEVNVGGTVRPYITSVSFEVKNEIEWLNNSTLHNSLSVTSVSGTVYPSDFFVSSRVLSGTVQQYVTDDSTFSVNTWSTSSTLRIRTGASSANWHVDLNLPSVVYTNRLDPQEVFIQSFDFRLTSSPASLASLLTIA